jgi:hypothetical protein
MMENMDFQLDKMEACLEKKTTDLEAYPEEIRVREVASGCS